MNVSNSCADDGRASELERDRKTGFKLTLEHASEADTSSLSRSTTPPTGWKDPHIDSTVQVKINRDDRRGASLALAAADRAREAANVVAMAVARRASLVEGASSDRHGERLTSDSEATGAMEVTPVAVAATIERCRTAGPAPAKKPVTLVRLTEAALQQHTAQSLPLSVRERLACQLRPC